jgi:hypothetical protein
MFLEDRLWKSNLFEVQSGIGEQYSSYILKSKKEYHILFPIPQGIYYPVSDSAHSQIDVIHITTYEVLFL